MDFAADAVFDAIAPQPRAANTRAPATDSGPSFDDHLEAVSAEEAPPTESSASETEKPDTGEKSSTTDVNAAPQPATAPPSPAPQPSPQFILQLVAPEAPAAAPTSDSSADEFATTPVSTRPAQPITPQAPAETTPADTNAPVTDGAKPPQPQHKADADPPKADAAPPVDAPDSPPPAPVQNNAPVTPAVPVTSAPMSAEATEAITAIASQAAPTQPIARAAAARTAKSDTRAEGKVEAPPEANAAAAQPPATRNAPKSAPTPQGNKDTSIAAAPPTIDTPDAPAPASQPTALSTPAATQTQHATLEHNVTRTAPAAAQVAREIVRQFDGETTRFEMRLDPPELGRVEVRLEVSRDNRVNAVIAADSPQALNELARHARELEQMLQSSGLQLGENGLSFDLRQGGEGNADANDNNANARGMAASDDASQQQATTARPLGYERWRGVRVDVMV